MNSSCIARHRALLRPLTLLTVLPLVPVAANAQVVTIGFAASPVAVPLGSGMLGALSLSLALAAAYLLRSHRGGTWLLALLALGSIVLASRPDEAGAALPAPADTAHIILSGPSPAVTGYLGFCFPPGGALIVTNGQPNPINLTGIDMVDGHAVALAAPVGTATPCTVGTNLPVGGTCYIGTLQTAC